MVAENLRLEFAAEGYRLMSGFNCRAIIIPTMPNRYNGRSRWIVDAIGLPGGQSMPARTLRQAKAIAYHFAT